MARIIVFAGMAGSLIRFRGALLQEMIKLGHQVYTCAPNTSSEIKQELTTMGVVHLNINLDRTSLNPLLDVLSLISLVKIFNEIRPNVFLGYTIKPVLYGSIAAHLAGVPKIYSIITGLGYAFSGIGFKKKFVGIIAQCLYRLALRYNHRVFFQNPDDLNLFTSTGIVTGSYKAVLINGSGVDLDIFQIMPYPKSLSFLLIARLIKEKGVYEYVEAARIIRQKHPTIKFKLVGFIDKNPSAISEQDLISWIESGTIEYLGLLKDVRSAISNASVYILPSYYPEGTPRSVLEAMSMGRPIVTTDSPGCRETVQEGKNGFLIPIKNVPALVNAIENFIKQPETVITMGYASRKIAETKYDVHKVNNVMLKAMDLL